MKDQIANFRVRKLRAQPAIDADITYDANDVMNAPVLLEPALPVNFRGELVGLQVYSKNNRTPELDVVFLNSAEPLGTVGAAVTIADASAQAAIERIVRVDDDAWKPLAADKHIADIDCGKPLQSRTGQLYVALIDRTGGIYNADDLTITAWVRSDDPA
jgi:hypothetical protein